MKTILNLLLVVLTTQVFSQTQTLDSKVVAATVYNSGAQVTSQKKVSLNPGTTTLIFENLSPNIDASSIILDGLEGISLNSIAYETDFLNEKKASQELETLKNQLKSLQKDKVYKENKINALKKSIALLEKNQDLKGEESELNVDKIRAYKTYYSSEIETLSNSIYDLSILVDDLNTEIQKLENEIRKLERDNRVNRGKITVELDVEKPVNPTLSLKYFIYAAGWHATYDLKSTGIDEDIQLNYKAKVYQNSGQDWNNIDLKLSTANPTSDKTKPEIEPYYLDFNLSVNSNLSRAKSNFVYNPYVKTVKGRVLDIEGHPIPGVNVVVGNRGTQTDFEGNYFVEIQNEKEIAFSFLGYKTETFPIYNQTINVRLEEDTNTLDEVVLVGYSSAKRSKAISSENQKITESEEQQLSVEFVIPKKVSLASGADDKQLQLNQYQLPTEYEYYAAPELSNSVFLMAEIKEWNDLNLISGMANLYYEDSFLGTTPLNTNSTEDHLFISLGIDENIILERTLPNKTTSKTFFGNNTVVEKAYNIAIKNAKTSPISILVQERLPISRNEDIKVENIEYNKATYDKVKGFLNWEFELSPAEKTNLNYSYSVKYPKNRNLNLRP